MPFTKSKRSVVKVPGYYDIRKKGSNSTDKKESRTSMLVEVEGRSVANPPVQVKSGGGGDNKEGAKKGGIEAPDKVKNFIPIRDQLTNSLPRDISLLTLHDLTKLANLVHVSPLSNPERVNQTRGKEEVSTETSRKWKRIPRENPEVVEGRIEVPFTKRLASEVEGWVVSSNKRLAVQNDKSSNKSVAKAGVQPCHYQ